MPIELSPLDSLKFPKKSNREICSQFIKKISNSIKFYRENKNYTQSKLASEIQLSTRHFQKIEAGQIDLKSSTIMMIAKSLSIEPSILLSDENYKILKENEFPNHMEILEIMPVGVQIHNLHGEILFLNE